MNSNKKDFQEADETMLNSLKEEYNIIQSKKNLLKDHGDIIKEIFITVKNRLEMDPFIIDKIKLKPGKHESGCCVIF